MAIFDIHWFLKISRMTPLMHNGNIIRLICISGCAWESMYFNTSYKLEKILFHLCLYSSQIRWQTYLWDTVSCLTHVTYCCPCCHNCFFCLNKLTRNVIRTHLQFHICFSSNSAAACNKKQSKHHPLFVLHLHLTHTYITRKNTV